MRTTHHRAVRISCTVRHLHHRRAAAASRSLLHELIRQPVLHECLPVLLRRDCASP